MKKEVEAIETNLKKERDNIQVLLDEKTSLQKELADIKAIVELKDKEISSLKASCPSTSKQNNHELEKLEKELTAINQELVKKNESIANLSNTIEALTKQKDEQAQHISHVDGKLKQAYESLQKEKKLNEDSRENQTKLSDKIIELQKTINDLKNNSNSLDELKSHVGDREKEITKLKDENKILQDRLNKKQAEIDEVIQESIKAHKSLADENMKKKRVSKSKETPLQAQVKTLNEKLDAILKASESNKDLKLLLDSIDKKKDSDQGKSKQKVQCITTIQSFIRGDLTRLKYKDVKHRYKKIQEIVETEQSYIDSLDLIYAYYYLPLKELIQCNDPMVTQEEMDLIFCGIEKIREKNRILLGMLHERLSQWHAEQLIGDIFIEIMEMNLLDPHIEYIQKYNKCREFRLNLAKENKAFGQFLKINRMIPILENRSFDDFLINPVQRIPRYILLLSNLLQSTKATHPDHYNIQTSLRLFQEFTNFLNENNRRSDSMDDVSSRLQGVEELPENPNRLLLHEGPLTHVSEKERIQRYAFLFSDCIVFSKDVSKKKKKSIKSVNSKSYTVVVSIKLNSQVSVKELGQSDSLYTFTVNVKGTDNIFAVATQNDARFWVSKIQDALSKYKSSSSLNVLSEGLDMSQTTNKGTKRRSAKRSKGKPSP